MELQELTKSEMIETAGGKKEWIFALSPFISFPLALGIWVGYNE